MSKKTKQFINSMSIEDFVKEKASICETVCCPPLAHTEPAYETIVYRDPWVVCKQEGINPMNTINTTATANVTQKTDLQTQREYLLGRHNEVFRSFDYGKIANAMTAAFHLNTDNKPSTSKELFDGIASGKYTLDAKKVAIQDIALVSGNYHDEDDQYTGSPFYAMNFGGLSPDRLGYEKAADSFRSQLKLLKDQIMTGDPAASATALQALEAWTPPEATVAS